MKMANEELNRKFDAEKSVLKVLKSLNYEFVKSLGQGRIGSVIEVKCPYCKQTIAIKIVMEEDLMENELKIWTRLSHPNIVNLISSNYIDAARSYIFLMKKCVTSLEHRLGDPGFIFDRQAFQKATLWIKGVLEGINHLHEQSYAHMDLKMNNVLIDEEENALVADFDSLTSTEKMITT